MERLARFFRVLAFTIRRVFSAKPFQVDRYCKPTYRVSPTDYKPLASWGGSEYKEWLKVREGFGERELAMGEAQRLRVPFVDLDRITPPGGTDPERDRRLQALGVVPIKEVGDTIYVAMSAIDEELIEKVRVEAGMDVRPVLSLQSAIERALARFPL